MLVSGRPGADRARAVPRRVRAAARAWPPRVAVEQNDRHGW